MKRKNIAVLGIALMTTFAFSSCSDSFLQELKNYDMTNSEAYNYYSGAKGRLDDIIYWSLPSANDTPNWKYGSSGLSDDHSKATEEYAGFSPFVDPEKPMKSLSGGLQEVPDYFNGTDNGNIQYMTWGRIRNINDAIAGIEGSTLSDKEKNELLGQVYFFRAWCYYLMVKWYGGVPIITEVQDPVETSVVPRSSTKACIDFICSDLDKAAEMLAPFTTNGGWNSENYGRVTSGTALALKGRVLILWASPLFNRANDKTRWETAYDVISKSIPVIESCGNALVAEGNGGNYAKNWANIFVTCDNNPEAIFFTKYNTIADGGAPDYSRNNTWENGIRPSNANGGGGKTPSSMIIDMFPMADGKRPATCNTYSLLEASEEGYDPNYPFMNRDQRFYRTFAFPGVRWTFNGDPRNTGNNNPYDGSTYELWNYVWYTSAEDRNNIESTKQYGSDNLLANAKGMYVRKRSDDKDINGSPLYEFEASSRGFKRSAAPYIEIRYAEVILNLAEAACNSGNLSVAVDQLKRIRSRVGYTADNNYGLQANLTSSEAACMSAILYERQIEFAYEGKRFDDLRRWMLFDGGAGHVEGAPTSWTLTGWGGNTCTYLGFTPLNGKRREIIEFRVKSDYKGGLGGKEWTIGGTNPDPLSGIARPTAINFSQAPNKVGPWLEALKTWYSTYLERNTKKGDSYDSNHIPLYMNFEPYYYFLGLGQKAQTVNTALEQNIGWQDYNKGGTNGTFDPLAE